MIFLVEMGMEKVYKTVWVLVIFASADVVDLDVQIFVYILVLEC